MTEQVQTANGRGTAEHFVAKSRIRATARAEVKQYATDVIEPAVGMALGRLLREAVAPLEARIAALETRAANLKFVGAWQEGMHCRSGNFTSLGGALFYCVDNTDARPGTDASFLLVCARPRDGRDGKDFTPSLPSEPSQARTTRSHR